MIEVTPEDQTELRMLGIPEAFHVRIVNWAESVRMRTGPAGQVLVAAAGSPEALARVLAKGTESS